MDNCPKLPDTLEVDMVERVFNEDSVFKLKPFNKATDN